LRGARMVWNWLANGSHVLVEVLEHVWRTRPRKSELEPRASDFSGKAESTISLYTRPLSKPAYMWLSLAEECVAMQVAARNSWVFAHLRNLLTFVTAGVLLMLLAVASYPFQPRAFLMLFVGCVGVFVASVAVTVFVQIGRDEVLSRIAKT